MNTIFTVVAIFHLLVFVIGVPGNLLILQVFGKKTRKTSTNVFIMALASSDIIACLLRPMFVGYFMVYYTTGVFPSIYIEIVYFALNLITVYSSTLITAAIAFDRYDAVCRPHTRLMSYRGAQGLALCCFVVSLPMTVPSVLIYFDQNLPVVLAKSGITLVAYIFALVLVLVFYVRVYKAVLFRTKVRTKWGCRFSGITTAGENSVSATGQTEVSALPPTRECTKLSVVEGTLGPRAGNHVREGVNPPQTQPTPQYPPTVSDTEVACVNADKNAVVYHNFSSGSNIQPVYPDMPPEYTSLTPASNPAYLPITPGPSSSTVSHNLDIPSYSQIPPSRSNAAERPGSTGRQRTPSEKGKSSKTVAARMQNRTTRMLLLTTIVFFVTWIPYMCLSSMSMHVELTGTHLDPTLVLVFHNAAYLLYINNAANPFIYVLANRQFRNDCKREIRKLLRSCSRR